ncbi:ABC transporter ATP-binding protein [Curtobacterium sp. 'Ferrero']|nr:ABC transporter ATP-binding protein [Curtobacterium sp. 'Ferrero']
MGDGDARDASDDDDLTDDTTIVDHDAFVDDPARADDSALTDSTATEPSGDTATGSGAVDAAPAAAEVAPTAPAPAATGTAAKGRTGKKRAKRPAGAAAPSAAASTTAAGPRGTDQQVDTPADDARPTGKPAQEQQPAQKQRTTAAKRQPGTKRPTVAKPAAEQQPVVLRASGLVKRYGQTLAADEVDLEIRQGSIFGVVGPNGAGKTTTLSMVTGLLRPDAGSVTVLDHDVWADPTAAKRSLGVLPDRLRLFDRLTGGQLLYYSATLRGLDGATARDRSADLAEAFGLGEALGRQVADYSVGMAKKIALAATLIHSPRVLVLDEPFESVDPVSAATITDILRRYTAGGGTVVLSSHSMELVQRTCDSVAIIVGGKVLASGTMAQVRGRKSLEDKFVELAGGRVVAESMEWLHSFSG